MMHDVQAHTFRPPMGATGAADFVTTMRADGVSAKKRAAILGRFISHHMAGIGNLSLAAVDVYAAEVIKCEAGISQ